MVDRDGKNRRQVTHLDASTFAPFPYPNDKRVIFSTNLVDPQKRAFNLFAINTGGGFLEQITFKSRFYGFPMFSRDGKKLVWASSRNSSGKGREINVFTADWVD